MARHALHASYLWKVGPRSPGGNPEDFFAPDLRSLSFNIVLEPCPIASIQPGMLECARIAIHQHTDMANAQL